MISPVGGPANYPPPTPQPETNNVLGQVRQMKSQIGNLTDQLNKLLAEPNEASNSTFLSQMAQHVKQLSDLVNQVLQKESRDAQGKS